jgi:hypothetical protein
MTLNDDWDMIMIEEDDDAAENHNACHATPKRSVRGTAAPGRFHRAVHAQLQGRGEAEEWDFVDVRPEGDEGAVKAGTWATMAELKPLDLDPNATHHGGGGRGRHFVRVTKEHLAQQQDLRPTLERVAHLKALMLAAQRKGKGVSRKEGCDPKKAFREGNHASRYITRRKC